MFPATYAVADSKIQLSADIVVQQSHNKLETKNTYFKSKDDKAKYLKITNKGETSPLIISIPDIEYSIAVKNGYGTQTSEGKDFVWVEPGSYVVLRINEGVKFNDFIPIVYMLKKNKPKMLTVVPRKEINAAKETMVIDYKDTPEKIKVTNKETVKIASNFDDIHKIENGFYNVNAKKFISLNLDKDVFIISRNGMLGGSQYFTQKLIVYPNEQLIIKSTGVTHVAK